MRRIFLVLLGCLVAGPVMASQPSEGQSSEPQSSEPQSSEPKSAPSSDQASQAPPANGSESSQTALVSNIEGRIATGWDKYDASSTGYLSPAEFSTWMNDLRAENGNGPADDAIMRRAFLVADSDKDTKISRDELTSFMMLRNRVKTSAGR